MDVVRYPELFRGTPDAFAPAYLHRWRLDPAAEKVTEQTLDDRPIEFPRVDDRLTGRRHRFGYAVANLLGATIDESPTTQLLRYDLAGGTTACHDFGAGRAAGEGVFAPAGAGEEDGYVLSFVYDAARDASELVVLDASSFEADPVARIALPQRVPFGFHGNWIPDDE